MADFKAPLRGNGQNKGPEMQQRQKQKPTEQAPEQVFRRFHGGPGMEPLIYRHIERGQEVEETIWVPATVLAYLGSPGETGKDNLTVMRELSEFYNTEIAPRVDGFIEMGGGSIAIAEVSNKILRSYHIHARLILFLNPVLQLR